MTITINLELEIEPSAAEKLGLLAIEMQRRRHAIEHWIEQEVFQATPNLVTPEQHPDFPAYQQSESRFYAELTKYVEENYAH